MVVQRVDSRGSRRPPPLVQFSNLAVCAGGRQVSMGRVQWYILKK